MLSREKKSFQVGRAAAVSMLLLPKPMALGRGLNNGADSANAMTTVLIDSDEIKLQLSLYNVQSEQDKSVLELHGDLDLELKKAAALYQEYGWCLGQITPTDEQT